MLPNAYLSHEKNTSRILIQTSVLCSLRLFALWEQPCSKSLIYNFIAVSKSNLLLVYCSHRFVDFFRRVVFAMSMNELLNFIPLRIKSFYCF